MMTHLLESLKGEKKRQKKTNWNKPYNSCHKIQLIFSCKLCYMKTLSRSEKAEISHKVMTHIQCRDSYNVVDCGQATAIGVKFNTDNMMWIISMVLLAISERII